MFVCDVHTWVPSTGYPLEDLATDGVHSREWIPFPTHSDRFTLLGVKLHSPFVTPLDKRVQITLQCKLISWKLRSSCGYAR